MDHRLALLRNRVSGHHGELHVGSPRRDLDHVLPRRQPNVRLAVVLHLRAVDGPQLGCPTWRARSPCPSAR
eukprot:6361748-Pyramimonas_sp.AAC.1